MKSDLRFVYDGWLLVMEFDALDPLKLYPQRKYTWGLDLSGQNGNISGGTGVSPVGGLQGAGGIGGLLAVWDTMKPATAGDEVEAIYFYDGNGNVGQLVDPTDGKTLAAYEYDPYGNTVASAGSYDDINPFRFSTKYHDVETGLYYYGYRYYDAELGRWLTRDPIGERGGNNLYLALLNAPIQQVDPHGLCPVFDPMNVTWFGTLNVSNKYFQGTWTGELSASVSLSARVKPGLLKAACCPQVAIVQLVRERYDGDAKYGPWVRDDGLLLPYYPHGDPPGTAGNGPSMTDNPGWNPPGSYSNNQFEHQFETCVVCVPRRGKVGCPLGCIRWAYDFRSNPAAPPPHLVKLTLGSKSVGPAMPAPVPGGGMNTPIITIIREPSVPWSAEFISRFRMFFP